MKFHNGPRDDFLTEHFGLFSAGPVSLTRVVSSGVCLLPRVCPHVQWDYWPSGRWMCCAGLRNHFWCMSSSLSSRSGGGRLVLSRRCYAWTWCPTTFSSRSWRTVDFPTPACVENYFRYARTVTRTYGYIVVLYAFMVWVLFWTLLRRHAWTVCSMRTPWYCYLRVRGLHDMVMCWRASLASRVLWVLALRLVHGRGVVR